MKVTTLHPSTYDKITEILDRKHNPIPRQVVDRIIEAVVEDATPCELFSLDELLASLGLPVKFSTKLPTRPGTYLYVNTVNNTSPMAVIIAAADLAVLKDDEENDVELWAGPLPVKMPYDTDERKRLRS